MAIAPWPTDHFLIAVPALADPDFTPGATHICQHDHDGAAMQRRLPLAAPTG